MELLQLRYFTEAAKQQHITKAAKSLHIAQPALSQAIHRLEDELGVQLFARRSRGIALTAAGEELYRRLEPLLESLDALPQQVQAAADSEKKTISLKIRSAVSMVTDCIIAYKKLHSDVNFRLIRDREYCDYDLCIYASISPVCKNSSILLSEQFFLAVPKNSAYAEYKSVELKDTADDGYICMAESSLMRSFFNHFCQEAGFTPHIVFESDNPESVRNLISAGLGIGFWPQYTWGEMHGEDVVLVPIKSPVCRRQLILERGENPPTEIVKNFESFMFDFAKSV